VGGKRPASTEVDELSQAMGASQRYSPVVIGRAGVGDHEFGAAAAAAAAAAAGAPTVHRQLRLDVGLQPQPPPVGGEAAPQPLDAEVAESARRLSSTLHLSAAQAAAAAAAAASPGAGSASQLGSPTVLGSPGVMELPATSLLFRWV
jgi:hypothetical protein